MRIQELYIQQYHVLHKITLPFEPKDAGVQEQTYKLDLIVGVNGTGKSTLLRLLAELFQYLDKSNRLPPFGFRIRYLLHKDPDHPLEITISNLDEDKQQALDQGQNTSTDRMFFIKVLDEQGALLERGLRPRVDSRYLPSRIIAFTSGSENGWELATSQHISPMSELLPLDTNAADFEQQLSQLYMSEQQALTSTKPPTEVPSLFDSRFLFIQNHQLPLVILCGLLLDVAGAKQTLQVNAKNTQQKESTVLREALKEAKIETLCGFSLKFHREPNLLAPDDETFITTLQHLASHIVQSGKDSLFVFDLLAETGQPSPSLVSDIIRSQGNGLKLFTTLNELTQKQYGREAILQEVNLFLKRDYHKPEHAKDDSALEEAHNLPPLHLLEWLSDGEISFLGRLCLLSLLRETEALVLLDEPEVHFNDYWKRQLVHLIDQCLDRQHSHVLMTTHSSITLSDVHNTNIWVLQRHGNFTEHVAPPNLRTLGTDPSDIIVHIFNAESATGAQSVAYLQRRIQELRSQSDQAAKKKGFEALLNQVGPGPWRFWIRRELLALEDVQR